MTVSNSLARHVYVAGEGATPPYPIAFPFHENIHVAVTHRGADGSETPWLEGSQYTLDAAPDGSGGTLAILAGHALDPGESLVIARTVPMTQEADYQESGRFPAETHERALDKLTMIAQQLHEALGRALAVPTTDQAPGLVLPIDAERAGRFLAFDGEGRPVAAAGTSADLAPVSAFMNGLLDDGDAASARATLGLHGLDLDPTSALPWRIFTVTGASGAFNDAQTGGGGEGETLDHDISWMDGLWIAANLYWDAAHGILSRYEAHKDEPALAIHLGTNGFPDIIGGFSAISHFRVQGRAAATAAGNAHKDGLPDRLVWPAAGSVGGVEMVEIWTTQGQRAAGGSTSEMDGDGAAHAYNRRVHVKLSDDGTTAVWFSGFVSNSFAAGDAVDSTAHPSVRWGLRQTLDVSSGHPASYATTKAEYVCQYAAPTGGVPVFADLVATRLDNIDVDLAPSGPLRKGVASTYVAPLSDGPKAAVAHGLGGAPDFFKVELLCRSAGGDLGYVENDRIVFSPASPFQAGGTGGVCFIVDSLNYTTIFDAGFCLPNKSTGVVATNTAIDPTKWDLIVTPYRLATD